MLSKIHLEQAIESSDLGQLASDYIGEKNTKEFTVRLEAIMTKMFHLGMEDSEKSIKGRLKTLQVNAGNGKLSDADFRDISEQILEGLLKDDAIEEEGMRWR